MPDLKSEMTPEQRIRHEFERGILNRVETVERENRRLRRLWVSSLISIAVLLGLASALVIVSARHGLPGTVADVIESRQFLLRDADGMVRGAWGTLPDGTMRLSLQAPGSKAGVTLTALKSGASGLTFSDSSGRSRGVFGILPDETLSLTFGDRTGMTRTSLGLNPEGSATLVFADRTGAMRAGMGVDSRGAGTFTVVDRPGAQSSATQSEPDDSAPPDTAPAAPAPKAPAKRR
ncbi:MAG TPA: hypothetical protein VHR41_14530 [Gemmatimonadales bacterium]|jgi:hypothetical protein|nr:hypothetical protein [Gemmatimonadales bacterium]